MLATKFDFLFISLVLVIKFTVQFVVETSVEDAETTLPPIVDAFPQDDSPGEILGNDFPNFTEIPFGMRFSCRNREPGFYANPLANCQVYHHCLPDGRMYTFLCGVGTVFNQRAFTCDHWYNYNCADAEHDYKYNYNFYPNLVQEESNTENGENF